MKTLLIKAIADVEDQEDLLNMPWVGDGNEEFNDVVMSDYYIVNDDFTTTHSSEIKKEGTE
jgi:hypothetical protein